MGYTLNLGSDDSVPLASLTGWSDVNGWSQSLAESQYSELLHLIDHGWSDDLPRLESQVQAAVGAADSDSVRSTMRGLLQSLKSRPAGIETVSVSDGMGPDDGAPDDWVVGGDHA